MNGYLQLQKKLQVIEEILSAYLSRQDLKSSVQNFFKINGSQDI